VKEFTEEMQEPEEFSITETLKELRRLCNEDKGFFFETLENEAGQVLGLVFASSTMVADARRYGDLVNMDFFLDSIGLAFISAWHQELGANTKLFHLLQLWSSV
jgi:hypothetical protein